MARQLDKDLLTEVMEIAKINVEEKRIDDLTESTDITLYQMVSSCDDVRFYKISDLVNSMRIMMGDGNHDWLNSKWMGRGL